MKTFAAILGAAALAVAVAECPNGCSGHGTCGPKDACECYDNWMGGDCSQRVCPFGLSFVDTPLGDLNHDGSVSSASVGTQLSNANFKENWQGATADEGHYYAECSSKGYCDRAAGICQCFDGFTGSACQRTTCPNDCSGHGQCFTLREIAAGPYIAKAHPDGSGNVGRNFRVTDYQYGKYSTSGVSASFDYNLWDADKNQACVCDSGYFGPDCSMQDCPRGNDPLTNDPKHCGGAACTHEIQNLFVALPATPTDTDFYLQWSDLASVEYEGLLSDLRSETFTLKAGLTGDDIADLFTDVFESFPNGVLNGVKVTCKGMKQGGAGAAGTALDEHVECITPTAAEDELDFEVSYLYGPQGNVGIPQGYAVKIDNSVVSMDEAKAISFTFSDGSTDKDIAEVTSNVARLGWTYAGNSFVDAKTVYGTSAVTPANGNHENSPCSNRGLCDYTTGTCTCFAGYTREDCSQQAALAM